MKAWAQIYEEGIFMKLSLLGTAALAMALAACGSAGDKKDGAAGGDAKTETVAGSDAKTETVAAGPLKREAGNWKTDIKIVKMTAPGMPAGMESQMQASMPKGVETCITQEQVDKEDIADQMSKAGQAKDCTFDKKDIAGGKLDVAGTCKTPQGDMKMVMTGTITPKSSEVDLNMNGVDGAMKGMEMVMKVTSTHVGACKGS
jgi:hypothetical protein